MSRAELGPQGYGCWKGREAPWPEGQRRESSQTDSGSGVAWRQPGLAKLLRPALFPALVADLPEFGEGTPQVHLSEGRPRLSETSVPWRLIGLLCASGGAHTWLVKQDRKPDRRSSLAT